VVLAIGHDGGRGKRAYQTLRVPESVLQRVTDGSQNRESRCDLTGVLIRAYYAHRKEMPCSVRPVWVGRLNQHASVRHRRLQLLLTPAEHQRLAKYAMERDSTVSEVIRACIRSLVGAGEGRT